MSKKNYDEYDYMRILVNKDLFDGIMVSYSCFGWEIFEKVPSSVFSDTMEVTLMRSRWIEKKDKLQLLQVYMESGYSDIGKLRKSKYKRSTILGLSVGLLATLLLCVFIHLAIKASFIATFVCFVIVCVLIVAVLIWLLIALSKLKKVEDRQYEHRRNEMVLEIEKICKEASSIVYGKNVKGGENGQA